MLHNIIEIQQNKALSFRDIISGLDKYPNNVFQIELIGDYVENSLINYQGIELLKWLRVSGINNHCILISADPLISLLQANPKHAIIASKGVTFVNITESLPRQDDPRLLISADSEQLRELFRLDIDLKVIRHDEANIYGLLQLRKHHLEIEPTATFCDLETADDINHEIVRFVYGSDTGRPDPAQLSSAKSRLRELRKLEGKTIIYVDDKADKGWGDFLRIVLGSCTFKEIIPIAPITSLTLSREVQDFIDKGWREWKDFVNSSHLYISDLRLLDTPKERETTDFKNLLSYLTIKKLRKGPNNLIDDRLRVMYFTASNDLSKVKGLLDDKEFNPHIIFTKEGADQLLTAEQSFEKYLELIKSLYTLLSPRRKKKMLENLQIINLEEEEKKQKLADKLVQIYRDQLNGNGQSTISIAPADISLIYIDTNFFLEDRFARSLIELLVTQKEKIRIPATVRHELRYISENREEKRNTIEINATFFGNLIDELGITIDENLLEGEQRRTIENNLNYRWDFADEHILELVKSASTKTILLTNDLGLIGLVNGLNNPNVKIERKLGNNTANNSFSANSVSRNSIRRAPNVKSKVVNSIPFTVSKIQFSLSRKSFNFYKDGEQKAVISVKVTELPDLSIETLSSKLIGKTLESNSNAAYMRKILSS